MFGAVANSLCVVVLVVTENGGGAPNAIITTIRSSAAHHSLQMNAIWQRQSRHEILIGCSPSIQLASSASVANLPKAPNEIHKFLRRRRIGKGLRKEEEKGIRIDC